MKRKFFKTFFISVVIILLLFGFLIFTTGYCLERSGIKPYSFAYCTCLSSEIMKVPLTGIIGEPVYNATNWSDNGNPEYNGVRYRSNSSENDVATQIKMYFILEGFLLTDDSREDNGRYLELRKNNTVPLSDFNRKSSKVNVSIIKKGENLEIGVYQEYEY